MAKQGGGQAFPRESLISGEGGMTLRDYFAGKALREIMVQDHVDGQGDPARHSKLAYEYADAMILERAKP